MYLYVQDTLFINILHIDAIQHRTEVHVIFDFFFNRKSSAAYDNELATQVNDTILKNQPVEKQSFVFFVLFIYNMYLRLFVFFFYNVIISGWSLKTQRPTTAVRIIAFVKNKQFYFVSYT